MKKFLIVVGIIFVVAIILLFGWLYYKNSFYNTELVKVTKTKFSGGTFDYNLETKNRTNSDIELTITELVFPKGEKNRSIYFYYDESYPFLGTSPGNSFGVYNHLLAELQQKHIAAEVKIVDSSQLPAVMAQPDSVVIMSSGVLPDTIYSKNTNLVSPWLKSGGILVWAGDGLGYYFGTKNGAITSDTGPNSIGWSGQRALLGANYLEGDYIPRSEDSVGTLPTFLASALGTRSKFTQTGAFVSALALGDSLDLGYNYNFPSTTRTSLSSVKVGQGAVYLFGSVVLNREADIAWDISQLIVSDIADADPHEITSRKITLKSGDSTQTTQQVNVADAQSVRVIAFTTNPIEIYFYSQVFSHD